jgi:hypothetical protein
MQACIGHGRGANPYSNPIDPMLVKTTCPKAFAFNYKKVINIIVTLRALMLMPTF